MESVIVYGPYSKKRSEELIIAYTNSHSEEIWKDFLQLACTAYLECEIFYSDFKKDLDLMEKNLNDMKIDVQDARSKVIHSQRGIGMIRVFNDVCRER